MSLSVEAKSSDDMLKLAKAFNKFQKEDPTFRIHSEPETRQTIMSGMGELHLEIYTQRLNLEYNIKINAGKPKVSYRETLREVERYDYLHKRQSGGRGQYAHIKGRIEPLPNSLYDNIEFLDETCGMAIPKNYIPSIQKGFYEACERGCLSGHKISGIRFVIETGAECVN
ncbi:Elongation factor G, mitochondrial [Thelohanellus kitauei]|uniref:Elongation factor G, mitochondrial n=1 Tax=Thelohanellus kitauei TaxID=669202 RepID=A0A0C2JYV3_THEKT|nr:Elongation factor G, mitochondrial [Thelohanellus kitauei]